MNLLKSLGLMDKSPKDILERQLQAARLRLVEARHAVIHYEHECAKAEAHIQSTETSLAALDKPPVSVDFKYPPTGPGPAEKGMHATLMRKFGNRQPV